LAGIIKEHHIKPSFDALPATRQGVVENSFKNADANILKVVECFSNNLNVDRCRKTMNPDGQFVTEISHYTEADNTIYMDETKDNEEYAITFRHEYGHFTDAQLNRPSMDGIFTEAITADCDWYNTTYDDGLNNLNIMLDELENSDVLDSRYLSDILSGMFRNDPIIVETYYRNGVAFYHHTDTYWDGITGPPMAVEREIFANLFGIYSENDEAVVSFVEKYFPNITARFKKALEVV